MDKKVIREHWMPLQLLFGGVLFVFSQVLMSISAATLNTLLLHYAPHFFAVTAGPDYGVGNGFVWHPIAVLTGMLIGGLVSIGGYYLALRLGVAYLPKPQRISVWPRRPEKWVASMRELAAGLGIGFALITLVVLLQMLFGVYHIKGFRFSSGVLFGIAVGIGPGLMEEVLFRGFIQRAFTQWVGPWIALAATSLMFGLVHLGNPGATWIGVIGIVIEAGIMLGAAYLLTGSLWLGIGIHAAWNTAQSAVFDSSVSGTFAGSGIIRAEVSGAELLTGGSMGPEGSIFAIVIGAVFGIYLLYQVQRRNRETAQFTPVSLNQFDALDV